MIAIFRFLLLLPENLEVAFENTTFLGQVSWRLSCSHVQLFEVELDVRRCLICFISLSLRFRNVNLKFWETAAFSRRSFCSAVVLCGLDFCHKNSCRYQWYFEQFAVVSCCFASVFSLAIGFFKLPILQSLLKGHLMLCRLSSGMCFQNELCIFSYPLLHDRLVVKLRSPQFCHQRRFVTSGGFKYTWMYCVSSASMMFLDCLMKSLLLMKHRETNILFRCSQLILSLPSSLADAAFHYDVTRTSWTK